MSVADGLSAGSLARDRAGMTALVPIDAMTGIQSPSAVLPAACRPGGVTVATLGQRAACEDRERRADLMMFDGLRP
jgi:hypothetical protein